jgi:hypothetical protein
VATIYSYADPGFFRAIHPERWRAIQERAKAAQHADVGSIIMSGNDADATAPIATFVRLEPGGTLQRHPQPAWRVLVVTHGRMDAGDRRMQPGDVYQAAPGESFDLITAGPDGVSYVEFFSNGQALPEHDAQALAAGDGVRGDRSGASQ